ncbi:MAG: AbrB/MazE/SpoVT family DNA-binding domain-containing protein [archaeon]|nr:AbrB/MazE/SpoVT family DNA-binding domain-containing protein [archaeon]
MSSIIDGKGRIVIPKHLAEEIGLTKGDKVIFEKKKQFLMIKKAKAPEKRLDEIMSWNPKRTGKPEPVSPREMKEIWKV